MKCPRCGSEMAMDAHRKYSVPMCYNCGYMEGRNMGEGSKGSTNFEHLKTLNLNEMVVFLSAGTGVTEGKLADWLCSASEK